MYNIKYTHACMWYRTYKLIVIQLFIVAIAI